MKSRLSRIATGALAALAIAAPTAGAAERPPSVPVASGVIEHDVYRITVTGPNAIPSDARVEHWTTATTKHIKRYDIATGRLEAESLLSPAGSVHWTRDEDELYVDRTPVPSRYAGNSRRREGTLMRLQVQSGAYREAGSTTFAGRPAIILESVPGKFTSDVAGMTGRAIVDAATYVPLERISDAPGSVKQVMTLESSEDLPLAGNRGLLRMGEHAGARVTGPKAKREARKKARRQSRRAAAPRH